MKILDENSQSRRIQAPSQGEEILWVQDRACVILVNEAQQRTARLEGDEARLWGWLNAGLSSDRCVRLMGVVSDIPLKKARQQIDGCIKNLQKDGWLGELGRIDE